jgi:hypothetical protein
VFSTISQCDRERHRLDQVTIEAGVERPADVVVLAVAGDRDQRAVAIAVVGDQHQCDRRWPRAEDGRVVPLDWYTQLGADGVVDGATYLFGLAYPDGYYVVARWTPAWAGRPSSRSCGAPRSAHR